MGESWGTQGFLGRLGDVGGRIDKMSEEAAKDVAEYVLGQAIEQVPLEDGDLSNSGKVSAQGNKAVVYFDTPYAVRQHEEMNWKHDEGRKAKYLEDPMNEAANGPAQALIKRRMDLG